MDVAQRSAATGSQDTTLQRRLGRLAMLFIERLLTRRLARVTIPPAEEAIDPRRSITQDRGTVARRHVRNAESCDLLERRGRERRIDGDARHRLVADRPANVEQGIAAEHHPIGFVHEGNLSGSVAGHVDDAHSAKYVPRFHSAIDAHRGHASLREVVVQRQQTLPHPAGSSVRERAPLDIRSLRCRADHLGLHVSDDAGCSADVIRVRVRENHVSDVIRRGQGLCRRENGVLPTWEPRVDEREPVRVPNQESGHLKAAVKIDGGDVAADGAQARNGHREPAVSSAGHSRGQPKPPAALGGVENSSSVRYEAGMAQADQELLRGIIRSVSKRLDWDASPGAEGSVKLTLRQPPDGEAKFEVSRSELDAAFEGGVARYRLRERVKKVRKRIRDSRKPYMPWRLPKIEPIGAPGPRGWSGGRR
jgi:hypothetical protein